MPYSKYVRGRQTDRESISVTSLLLHISMQSKNFFSLMENVFFTVEFEFEFEFEVKRRLEVESV